MNREDFRGGATLSDIDSRLEALVIVLEDIRDIMKEQHQRKK